MSGRNNTDYLYASTRVRALERNLLNRERIVKMLDSKNLDDSIKVLDECEYGDGQELRPAQYEILLSREHQKALGLLRTLDKELLSLFLLQYDYLNAKILLKAEFAGIEDCVFSPLGQIEVAKLRQSLRERTFDGMTGMMAKAGAQAIEEFGKMRDPQCIDLIMDNACYAEMLQTAQKIGSDFLSNYVKREIDGVNIRAYVRIKRQGGGREMFQRVFIAGGKISMGLFVSHFDDDMASFVQALAYTEYSEVTQEALPAIRAGNLGTFEKLFDDYRIKQIKKAKLIPFGIEPLVAYIVAKESDIKTARIILAGKAAGIPPECIAEKVRETYV